MQATKAHYQRASVGYYVCHIIAKPNTIILTNLREESGWAVGLEGGLVDTAAGTWNTVGKWELDLGVLLLVDRTT